MEKNIYEESLEMHAKYKGKISIACKTPLETQHDLSLAYTPGVSQPCLEIKKNPENAYLYTSKGNLVGVITDGTSVLGLGDIGPLAAIPVMEGKSVLFKKFANIDAFPICINSKDSQELISIIEKISPVFGGILLEDISAPRCFEIEETLKKKLNIPVFHDDQHGTAVVVVAGLINSLKLVKKDIHSLEVVINGAGAAGIAIAKLLNYIGVGNCILCDTQGAIFLGRPNNMAPYKKEIAKVTNRSKKQGSLAEVLPKSDVFIGVSQPDTLTKEMIKTMSEKSIIFALSNPIPEIMPQEAKKGGAYIICTGRSDFSNQVNNVLAFPGIFRGALNIRAKQITEEMKLAAAYAIADLIPDNELTPDYVIPKPFDPRVCEVVTKAIENIR